MISATFVIDESGAKGYSGNREKDIGELGVIAGFIVPNAQFEKVESEITEITKNYLIDGKLHITDLKSSEQESLRDSIFAYFISVKAYWVYEATYVEGLYANAQFVKNMADEAKASRRSSIRVSSKEKMDMLHSELFVGAFGKGVAFCYDNLGKNFKLNVITDNVDKSILNLFNERAQQLLSIGEERIHEVKGFDTDTSSIVKGSITFDYTQMTDILGDFSQVQYDISVSDSSLTVAADVLVNSVWYHLKTLQKTSPGCPLNTIEAISGHPLSSLVVGVTDSNSLSVQIADTIYRHPNQS